MVFSPKHQLKGQCVLLTGGLGYEGSIVLEQLLRLTEVKTVYLLVRARKNVPAAKRVQDLLCSPLFNMVHQDILSGKRNPFNRVHPVEGDLTKPSLGLTHQDLRLLRAHVNLVLHCGALIELEADVQKTLRNNYLGTWELMKVCSQMDHLRAFVYVSTYFVNNHLPRNSVVQERLYPLPLEVDGEPVGHREYVAAMLSMDAATANRHTADLLHKLSFTSTYAFGKHLAEQLVDGTVIKPGVSRAIVRPSLIAAVAQDPYPGYIKSFAGAAGYSMGYALGFFQGCRSVAYGSDTILDLIPADTVAYLIIAAGAAAATTYGSPCADRSAVIFHAAASQSNPLSIGVAFETLATFWKANPPPVTLPATSYPCVKAKHTPTPEGIAAGQRLANFKLRLLGSMLKLLGRTKELQALQIGLKAFHVHNSLPYNKSMICSLDNVRALHGQMPAREQAVWKVVFEPHKVMAIDHYLNTFFAGMRRLLMRMDGSVRKVQHSFTYRQPLGRKEAQAVRAAAGAATAARYATAGPSLHAGKKSFSTGSLRSRLCNSSSDSNGSSSSSQVQGFLSSQAGVKEGGAEPGAVDAGAAAAITEAAATVAAAALMIQGVLPPAAAAVAAAVAVAAVNSSGGCAAEQQA